MLTEYRPLMTYTVWRGPLADPSNSSLDTDAMRKTVTGVVGEGQTVNLLRGCLVDAGPPLEPSGEPCPERAVTELTLAFPELRNYSVLHVSRDPGVPIVLVGAVLLSLGLLPALYTSRRRVWVQAEPYGDGAVIDLGGFAFQRRAQFEDEFSDLVEVVTSAAGGTVVCGRPAVSAGHGGHVGP
jgi:cytochrome c biogenesis protein ResB